jgi:hypothetical protein
MRIGSILLDEDLTLGFLGKDFRANFASVARCKATLQPRTGYAARASGRAVCAAGNGIAAQAALGVVQWRKSP